MRVAVLWTKLSGYMNVALQAMASHGCEILVVNEAAGCDAPFDRQQFEWITHRYEFSGPPEFSKVVGAVESFEPDVILCSWHVPVYQRACLRLRGRVVRVGCGDNQWRGTLRQQLGRLIAPVHLRRFYDVLFMTGERQVTWARKMGFAEERIWKGLYTCDIDAFGRAQTSRRPNVRAFLFATRLSPQKGIPLLLKAYGLYRRRCQGLPWTLILAGDGPLRTEVLNTPGVDWRGFVQPAELPAVFAEAACFIVPSLFEPWCVALHEAASAGLPLIATTTCGATVHLLQDGYNGCVVSPNSAEGLGAAMDRIARKPAEELAEMGRRSAELSKQFSPDRFANTVMERANEILPIIRRTVSLERTAAVVASQTTSQARPTDK
jgi:glycosyltransferase involved in cell wall biosynthesis